MIVTALIGATWYYVTPKYTRVGYQPIQPVPFPHDLHVSQLGMDCRYCHSFVEVAAHSNVPDTQICMNCHTQVQKDNPKLEPVRASWKTGQPVRVGADSSHAGLRLLQSLRARESRDQLRELPRRGQSHAGGLSCQAAQHGLVPGMPSRIRRISCDRKIRSQSGLETGGREAGGRSSRNTGKPKDVKEDWSKKKNLTQQEIGLTLKERWNIQPPTELPGVPPMKRVFEHPPER